MPRTSARRLIGNETKVEVQAGRGLIRGRRDASGRHPTEGIRGRFASRPMKQIVSLAEFDDNAFYRVRNQASNNRIESDLFACCLIATDNLSRSRSRSLRQMPIAFKNRRIESGELEDQLYGGQLSWPLAHMVQGTDRGCRMAPTRIWPSHAKRKTRLVSRPPLSPPNGSG